MCGIAGFIGEPGNRSDRSAAVRRMCDAMIHRGPDDEGLADFPTATLGMRRLAIFDPAHGHQPMATPDGRFTVVFNGAIYNFRSLREELSRAGFSFATDCDTEVLLAAFAHWGEGCLKRLQGMFAFAVWDAQEENLFLARDPFGIKPLYYHHDTQGTFSFASELNALLASRSFQPQIDPHAVAEYLGWMAVPAPRTLYRNVCSLRPGECATFRAGNLQVRRYWRFGERENVAAICGSREDFVHELRVRLETTIRAHSLADVPVGAFLSGGLDSAVVVGLMYRSSSQRLKTFSVGFAETEFSEATAAAETAKHFGTDHHTIELTGAMVAGDLENIIGYLDQPTGDGINTYYACRSARAGGVKAALSGLGGDELFGGYPSFHSVPKISRWLPRWRWLPEWTRNNILGRLRNGDTRKRKLADFLQHARTFAEAASLHRRVFNETTRASLLHPDLRRRLDALSPFHPALSALSAELGSANEFETLSAWEMHTYMADVLLRDSDVMSMRHSLELRVPFVDRPLIEWLQIQPQKFKFDPQQPKSALAAAVCDILPTQTLSRRKQGFTLPFPIWMKKELRPFLDETFSPMSINRTGLLAREPVQALWQNFLRGRDDRAWSRVWSLAVLIAFVNRPAAR